MEAPGVEPVESIGVFCLPVSVSKGLETTPTPGEGANTGVSGGCCPSDCGFCGSPTVKVVRMALEAMDRGRLDIARDLLTSILACMGESEGGEHE